MMFAFGSFFFFGYHVSLSPRQSTCFIPEVILGREQCQLTKSVKAVSMVSGTIIPYALAIPLVDQNVVYDAENPDHGSQLFNVAVGSLDTLWGELASNLQSVGELGVGMRDDQIWIADTGPRFQMGGAKGSVGTEKQV
jgi:hypothetical protein